MPFPTFHLPEYCLRTTHRWIEGNVKSYLDTALIGKLKAPSRLDQELKLLQLFGLKVPAYPYRRALSTYSAETQLLLRSHKLAVASRIGPIFSSSQICPSCGIFVEDESHVFVHCEAYFAMKLKASIRLEQQTVSAYRKLIPEATEIQIKSIAASAALLPFSALYYKLIVPPVALVTQAVDRVRTSIEMLWHRELMILAGQIWGQRMRNYHETNQGY